jgi:UDP:flavonoid glycosyltransferase YjiC (YdhE family)
MVRPRRVLFVAESVTRAQIVRLVSLAAALDRAAFEVHFASGEFPAAIFSEHRFIQHPLETLPPERVEPLLESGRPLYDHRTLVRYLRAELSLIERVQPELCVGDFRWTLASSAALSKVPAATLINAYWSPHASRPNGFPLPDHQLIRWLGEERVRQHFPKALPFVMKHFAAPLNAARREFGLPPLGGLLEVLCDGDYTLLPDDPELTPLSEQPQNYRFLGPVLWEPRVALPAVVGPRELPLVYVTLGSSGKLRVLEPLLVALAELPVRVLLATADRGTSVVERDRLTVAPFVPGSLAAREAALVISNGGSTTGYQALAEGTPVLGLPSNFDQFLASEAIVRAEAGLEVAARSATVAGLRSAIERGLTDAALTQGAARIAARFRCHNAPATFARFVDEALTSRSS